MKNIKNIFLIYLLAFMGYFAHATQSIEVITEDYPPYNYLNDDEELKGYAVDLLKEMFKHVDAQQHIDDVKLLPWPRGYALVQRPGLRNMLFSMTRTGEREGLFQ